MWRDATLVAGRDLRVEVSHELAQVVGVDPLHRLRGQGAAGRRARRGGRRGRSGAGGRTGQHRRQLLPGVPRGGAGGRVLGQESAQHRLERTGPEHRRRVLGDDRHHRGHGLAAREWRAALDRRVERRAE